ncbi:hypothetical protein FE257_011390 [Aspergillus nanangensis]|uniref:Uncharacterized protein n=1 Tax=Aspergillus nanangensis TaxID=2582783 RepID=A0AAD4GSK2_ASPNN|nr:hypothetical protein FE257_011390 [Aspergillus nanangensis]
MIFYTLIIAISLLGMGDNAFALLQTATGKPSNATSANDAVALPESVLNSLPIIPVAGDSSSAIIQSSNSSLIEARPEIDQGPTISLPEISSGLRYLVFTWPQNLTRRDQCTGGPFASPLTPWTNVKLLADRVCDFWFPNNQVFYVSAPLPAPGYVQVRIPFGPSLPSLNLKYQTVNPSPVTDLVTPLTSTICKKRFDSILAFATAPGNFQCPAPPNVNAGNDCDVTSRAACFTFFLS